MPLDVNRAEQLAATNPLFGKRRLKLGTFASNASGGCSMSSIEGALTADWKSVSALAELADAMAFEAIVPVARWRGFGGATDFNGASFESFTFAAAVGAQTRSPSVFATAHVPSFHPVTAAKQCATIDHVTGGRFTLNIVTGWNKSEMDLFGSPMMEHDERYAAAAEWIGLMKLLWTADEPVTFHGKFYNVEDAYLRPRPIQQPYPALMSAGASKKGRMFAAQHCDVAFASLDQRDPESIRAHLDSYRALARDEFGRDLKIWINAYIIQGETEAEARQMYNHCVHDKGDWKGVENLIEMLNLGSQARTPEILQKLREDFIAGWCGYALVGTKEQIVDSLSVLAEGGVDGVLLSWPAYIDGMKTFQRDLYPLLKQIGLR